MQSFPEDVRSGAILIIPSDPGMETVEKFEDLMQLVNSDEHRIRLQDAGYLPPDYISKFIVYTKLINVRCFLSGFPTPRTFTSTDGSRPRFLASANPFFLDFISSTLSSFAKGTV